MVWRSTVAPSLSGVLRFALRNPHTLSGGPDGLLMARGSAGSFLARGAEPKIRSANETQLSCYYAVQTYSQNFSNITTLT